MGAEQSGKAYFSLRPLNTNLRDLFIFPDVHCKVNCISLKKKVPPFYSLSSSLANCSFLISEASEDDLFRNSGFQFLLELMQLSFFPPQTQNAAAVIVEEHCFCSSLFLVYSMSLLPPGENLMRCSTESFNITVKKMSERVWKNLIERINKYFQ